MTWAAGGPRPRSKEHDDVAGRRLDALDGLRGVGALVVVVYHTLGFSAWFRQGMYDYRADGALEWIAAFSPARVLLDGRPAVMSFFVLSGFVLTRSFWKGRSGAWFRYYVRRLIRLYPPVLASAVLAVGLLALRQAIDGTGRGVVDLGAAGTSVSKLATNVGLLGLIDAPLNVVWWSLRWEMWFSVLLPVILMALVVIGCGPHRRFRATPAIFGLACVILVGLQPWIRLTYETSFSTTRAILYLPMFGVGVALAAFEKPLADYDWPRPRIGWLLLAMSFALIAVRGPMGWLTMTDRIDPRLGSGLTEALPLAGVGLFIVLLVSWPVTTRAMSARPLVWVGERSYSLYLVHLPLITLLGAVFAVDGASLWFIAVCVASSLGAMVVFYHSVERPSAELASRLGRPRPGRHRDDETSDAARARDGASGRSGDREPVGIG
ncbi:MAG TPA: acyltransferase [Acidimicrobiales bacterium]|nr:acyltransferase [Acidimicrobiales bacterium]